MKKMLKTLSVSLGIALLFFSFAITGCSRGPNENELAMLEESKSAALAAQQKQAECESEKASLESKLAEEKQNLEAMKQEKAKVAQRLDNFGN